MTRTVTVSTFLDTHPDRVWEAARTSRLLRWVAAPMVRFTPVDPDAWDEVWAERDYLFALHFYGVVPLGRQVISISYPGPEGQRRFVRDNGHSASIRRWDHLLTIEPEGGGTRYTDRLHLDAGLRTPPVAAFARAFYAHRQARWRRLAVSGFKDVL